MKVNYYMKKILLVVFAALFFVFPNQVNAEKIFKIGYLEGGEYWLFSRTMESVKEALQKQGWKDKIEFVDNAFFSPGWEEEESVWEKKAEELMKRDDLDLIISMGTAATKALLKKNNNKTPVLGMAVSSALKSGFIKNNEDSGIDNFTVRIIPGKYKRMFEIFHQVIGFKKLGLIYSDTENGKNYTNLETAKEVAKERGFEITEYKLEHENCESCLKGLETLVDQKIDAFFIPSLLCFDWKKNDVNKLFQFLQQKDIPSFARNGSKDVKAGALMGFSTVDFTKRGDFLADKIIKIFEGTKPRNLKMQDNATPKISLNIYVASKIGFDPPFDILAATDEIYQEINLPEDRAVK